MALKVVRTFGSLWEAGMARSILEAEGIPALVDGETILATGYFATPDYPNVRLLVNEEHMAAASDALEKWESPRCELGTPEAEEGPPYEEEADQPPEAL